MLGVWVYQQREPEVASGVLSVKRGGHAENADINAAKKHCTQGCRQPAYCTPLLKIKLKERWKGKPTPFRGGQLIFMVAKVIASVNSPSEVKSAVKIFTEPLLKNTIVKLRKKSKRE